MRGRICPDRWRPLYQNAVYCRCPAAIQNRAEYVIRVCLYVGWLHQPKPPRTRSLKVGVSSVCLGSGLALETVARGPLIVYSHIRLDVNCQEQKQNLSFKFTNFWAILFITSHSFEGFAADNTNSFSAAVSVLIPNLLITPIFFFSQQNDGIWEPTLLAKWSLIREAPIFEMNGYFLISQPPFFHQTNSLFSSPTLSYSAGSGLRVYAIVFCCSLYASKRLSSDGNGFWACPSPRLNPNSLFSSPTVSYPPVEFILFYREVISCGCVTKK